MSKTIEEILSPPVSAKGANHTSPGQRPGTTRAHSFPALKGRPNVRVLGTCWHPSSWIAPSGLDLFFHANPRALPWADMVRPVGADIAMTKPLAEILAPKPEARPRLYAYSIDDQAHAGLLKVGQTTPLPSLSSPSEGEERVAAGWERHGRSSSCIYSLSSIRNGGEGRGEEVPFT